ncbi:nucleotide sugar dehydrogenase [Pelagibacteraceae bacterium]|nr:nucleotide sugar dehydrogenase [Pelagibacteraceae bacterium]
MKIINNKFKIGVIGLGYVGLPLASILSTKYKVIGYDISLKRIKNLKNNIDSTLEISSINLKKLKNICFTNTLQELSSCNVYIIALPTPINSNNIPDLSKIKNATKKLSKIISKKDIIIYESTVYPGVTEEICVPILEKNSGLKFNEDFFCGYSPERINPGDKKRKINSIKKVVSGSNDKTLKIVNNIYSSVIEAGTYKAPSIKIAEAAKVIENTQRDLNIALINELYIIFKQMNLDINEILKAAKTKWNFISFTPGLVGGHCIGVDPYYLTYKSQQLGYSPKVILAGRKINDGMAKYLADQLIILMSEKKLNISKSNILIMGYTFKENCPDTRNTKVKNFVSILKKRVKNIDIYDPWVNHKNLDVSETSYFVKLPKNRKYDAIFIAVGHSRFRQEGIKKINLYRKSKSVLYDFKNIFPGYT